MTAVLLAAVRKANQEMTGFLYPMTASPDAAEALLTEEHLESLSKRLDEVGRLIGPGFLSAQPSRELLAELSRHGENLRRLQSFLGMVQTGLQKRRDHLVEDRRQLEAARAWAATYKDTG